MSDDDLWYPPWNFRVVANAPTPPVPRRMPTHCVKCAYRATVYAVSENTDKLTAYCALCASVYSSHRRLALVE